MAPRLVVSVCLALFLTLACGAALGFAAPPQPLTGNSADRLADRPIDESAYDHASRCRRGPSPGALALQDWLTLHVRGTSWGIMRCEKLSRRDYSRTPKGARSTGTSTPLTRPTAAPPGA